MEIRLKKVRDRKRLKLGLPILDDEDVSSKPIIDDLKTEKTKEISLEATVMESLKKLRDEHTSKTIDKESKRKQTIREWDLGKEGVNQIPSNVSSSSRHLGKNAFDKERPQEKPVLSQSEWVSEKRQQRNNEFAPPSNYDKVRKNLKDQDNSENNFSKKFQPKERKFYPDSFPKHSNESKNDSTVAENNEKRVFNNGLPQWNPDIEHKKYSETSTVEKTDSTKSNKLDNNHKLNPLTETPQNEKSISDIKSSSVIDAPNNHISSMLLETLNEQPTLSLEKRLLLHRDMMNNYGGTSTLGKKDKTSNSPSCGGSANIHTDASYQNYEDPYKRNKGVEIEPPVSMEYYNSNSNNSKFNPSYYGKKNSTLDSMKESLRIGSAKNVSKLKQNRKYAANLSTDSDSD